MELGAESVELDVHRTADGVIVVHHDDRLPDGRVIATLAWADLGAVRVRGEPIPRLESVFANAAGRLRVHVELKGRDTAADVLRIINEAAVPGQGAVHAFDHRLIARARSLDPTVPRGVLEVSYTTDPLAAAHSVDARDLWRHLEFIDEALVQAAHAEGRRVIAWTVNEADQMTRLAGIGVDGICSDDVALARRVLGA